MTIRRVVVAIPARDEEESIGECLRSVLRAARRLRLHDRGVQVDIIAALDRCLDGTVGVVAQYADAGVRTVVPARPGVGEARDAAVRAGLAQLPGVDPAQAWIACTDADSTVPATWLIVQVALANRAWTSCWGRWRPAVGSPRRSWPAGTRSTT